MAGGHVGGDFDVQAVTGQRRFMGVHLLPGKALLAGKGGVADLLDTFGGGRQFQPGVVGIEHQVLACG